MMVSTKWTPNVRGRLSAMMFLQYAYNGIWIIPLATYLTRVGYTGDNVGNAYGTFALGCIIAPFIAGMIADRLIAAQKMLGVLNILSGVFLYLAAKASVGADGLAHTNAAGQTVLGPLYWMLLAHFICYMPSWALTNTIALRQMDDPGKQFPGIRVMGTIGWIVVSMVSLFGVQINEMIGTTSPYEATATPMYIGAAIGILTGIFSFVLPDTPPEGKHKQVSVGDMIGAKAFSLLKEKNFAVFAMTSFMIVLPGMFYWNWANPYLNEIGVPSAQAWQSSGQMCEMIFLIIMPWFFMRYGVKTMLLMGLFAWIARFVCFAYGDWSTVASASIVVFGLLLHGPCYDFFFVTGQLYTDKKASIDIQAQAQGLIFLLTFGLGWFFGTLLAGRVVQIYAITEVADGVSKIVNHHWDKIWLWPIGLVGLIIVFFFFSFHDKTVVIEEAQEKAE